MANPYLKNIRILSDTHKLLKHTSVQYDCRIDVLADFIIRQFIGTYTPADMADAAQKGLLTPMVITEDDIKESRKVDD